MVERFFNGGSGFESDGISLLSGPPSWYSRTSNFVHLIFLPEYSDVYMLLNFLIGSGKTSLLFQYALNIVTSHSHSHGYVVFLCDRRRFHANPPFLSQVYSLYLFRSF